jgi:hypothetical protein
LPLPNPDAMSIRETPMPQSLTATLYTLSPNVNKPGDGFVNVQTHAQNFHSSTVSPREYMRRVQEVTPAPKP